MRIPTNILNYLILVFVIYGGLCLLLYVGQRKMVYHPYVQSLAELTERASQQGFKPWTNPAGTLLGWKKLSPHTGSAPQLLMLHGNGGNATSVLHGPRGLLQNGDWDIYSMEYPGYGCTSGEPTEESLYQAGRDAVESLKGGGPLYLMGISLGTGVATFLAQNYPKEIKGVLLVAPYDNLTSVGRFRMPIFPVKWMLKDRFASDEHLADYHGPVGMIFAGEDVVVPNRFGHRLYDGYNGPKKFWQIEGVGHNDLLEQPDQWWAELVAFWDANRSSK